MATFKYAELRKMTDDELIACHDSVAQYTNAVSPTYCLDELWRRETNRQTEIMLRLTKDMRLWTVMMGILTIIVTLLTVVNVGIVIWSVSRAIEAAGV